MTTARRGTGTMLLVASLLVMTAAPALAGPEIGDGDTGGGDDDTVVFVVTDEIPGRGGDYVPVGGPPPLYTMTYRATDFDPLTGGPCTVVRYILVYDEAERGRAADTVRLQDQAFATFWGANPPPPCSGLNIDPGAPARRAAEIVADSLTAATPYVQPDNRAITGIRSFLDTDIPITESRPVTVTLFGRDWEVAVDIEGVHTVRWGDGTVDEGVVATGGPWHAGEPGPNDITHHYLETGTYGVVVETDWTVTATLVATGATVTQGAYTESDPVPVEVTQVRSVRES